MLLGTASGFVVECLETYYPKSPRYYLANPDDLFCDWTHERDWMYLNLWGRLAYDPNTPDAVFDAMVTDRFGEIGASLVRSWKAAGRIISTAFSAFSLGPDHRNHAIELEWGGNTAGYIAGEPFDSHLFKSTREALADGLTGARDGRISPWEAAALLRADAAIAEQASAIPLFAAPQSEQKRLKELITACTQAAHLGRYYAERFLSAFRAAQAEGGMKEAAGKSTFHMREAEKEWGSLASCSFYKPFTERLRMHTNTFHWEQELPKVRAEADRLALIAASVPDSLPPLPPRPPLPSIQLKVLPETVSMALKAAGITKAWALVKPLPSSAFFHKCAMTRRGDLFVREFHRDPWGHAVAAEVERDGRTERIPGLHGDAPYLVIPSKTGLTPLLYSSAEALTFLDPALISPSKYGVLLVSSRASNFHRGFSIPVQRKILEPVRQGMTLIVLAQDYAPGRYTLDWLPKTLNVEARQERAFDPAGLLGMTRIEDTDIMRYRFLPSPGWDVSAGGGTAVLSLGKGRVVLIDARLLERLHVPGCAVSLEALLRETGHGKPVVVVDAGTEGGLYTSSVIIDFMNAREIPFLTLGEVVAEIQGARASNPIAGHLDDDDILASLDTRGERMVNSLLETKVKSAAALSAARSREELDQRRVVQSAELMRCLGLDPLPPRTPLNAKVTGVIERQGYRIEKIAFESRPNFPVTAHLYVPYGAAGRKLPVIVNPHGHWAWKKQDPTVQSRLIGQVLHGYLALVIDSPGYSFEGDNRVERRSAGTHDDLRLVLGSQNATSVYVWDLMRALDYLETRPEADMARIGLTGASGGGLATVWAFAAEPRFTCAAPVVFASSLETNPHNGCLCNHVPGTVRIGDRADLLSLRAPAPLLLIGAEDDREFPAAGMRLSAQKLRAVWNLFGKSDDAWIRMFPGGHDYSKPMRETVLGFFDKYLRGIGDGSPVPEPVITTEPPAASELYVLPEPPPDALSMRGIARAMFARPPIAVTAEDWIQLNGGLPEAVPPEASVQDESGGKRRLTFVSESGLRIPALLWSARGEERAFAVLVSENGKTAAVGEFAVERLRDAGISCLAVDPRGLGELKGLDLRLTTYLGQAPTFLMGWDIVRSIAALVPPGVKVALVGRGPSAGMAVLAASLIEPRVGWVGGISTLRDFTDAFDDGVPLLAVQPRANYAPSLEGLRGLVKAEAIWSFLNEPEPGWEENLIGWVHR
jgi:dienelactone hydrolase